MSNPLFAYFNDLSYDKRYLFDETYVPFAVGRYFSKFPDTILHVNQVNIPNIDKKMHHDYLFASMSKRKRFFKNKAKADGITDTQLEAIRFFYKVNSKVALDYSRLIPEPELDELVKLHTEMTKK